MQLKDIPFTTSIPLTVNGQSPDANGNIQISVSIPGITVTSGDCKVSLLDARCVGIEVLEVSRSATFPSITCGGCYEGLKIYNSGIATYKGVELNSGGGSSLWEDCMSWITRYGQVRVQSTQGQGCVFFPACGGIQINNNGSPTAYIDAYGAINAQQEIHSDYGVTIGCNEASLTMCGGGRLHVGDPTYGVTLEGDYGGHIEFGPGCIYIGPDMGVIVQGKKLDFNADHTVTWSAS